MNAGILIPLHGSLGEVIKKGGGDTSRLLEFLVIKKYSEAFDKVFVFSHDSESFEHMLPSNCRHIRLRNRLIYTTFGWMVVLHYAMRHRIKVIHAVCSSSLPLTFMVNRLSGARVLLEYVYLWYNTAGNKLKRAAFMAAEKILLNFVDHILEPTSEIKRFIGKKKIIGIKEGIILDMFDPKKTRPSKLYSNVRGKRAVFIGRLAPIKDPITLLEAHKIAIKSVPDLHLFICGDGELRKECEMVAGKNVHFLGFVGDVPGLLKGADMFVLPSLYDASPRALKEAMAMGLPCVATRVGGIPDYLDGCGMMVEPKERESLAKCMVELAKNPGKANNLGKKARKRMLEGFDFSKNLDKEIKFLKDRVKDD